MQTLKQHKRKLIGSLGIIIAISMIPPVAIKLYSVFGWLTKGETIALWVFCVTLFALSLFFILPSRRPLKSIVPFYILLLRVLFVELGVRLIIVQGDLRHRIRAIQFALLAMPDYGRVRGHPFLG